MTAGQTIIVTGAAHGFSAATAKAFAARGGHVWACDLVEDIAAGVLFLASEQAGWICGQVLPIDGGQ